MKACTYSSNGRIHVSSNKIYKSHKCSKFIFAYWFVGLFDVIFTNNVLYSTITLLLRCNIEIHFVLTLKRILFPFIPKILTNFVNFKCFVTNAQGEVLKANLIRFALLISLYDGPHNGPPKN